jgi:hypothetical protein
MRGGHRIRTTGGVGRHSVVVGVVVPGILVDEFSRVELERTGRGRHAIGCENQAGNGIDNRVDIDGVDDHASPDRRRRQHRRCQHEFVVEGHRGDDGTDQRSSPGQGQARRGVRQVGLRSG